MRQHVGQPERAGQEHALVAADAVHVAVVVGRYRRTRPSCDQLALDRRDRRDHARVVGGQEPDGRHQQHARVQLVGAVGLRERLLAVVPGLAQHLRVDLVAEAPPALDRPVAPELVVEPHRPIERHPCHHLGVGEVAVGAAHLPDAGVLLPPAVLQPPQQHLAAATTQPDRRGRRARSSGRPSPAARRRRPAAAAWRRRCRPGPAASRRSRAANRARARPAAVRRRCRT